MPHHHNLGGSHPHPQAAEALRERAPAPQFNGEPSVSWVFITESPQPTQQSNQGNTFGGAQQQQQDFSNPFADWQSFQQSQASAAAAAAQQQQVQGGNGKGDGGRNGNGPNFFDAGSGAGAQAQSAAAPTQSFAGFAGPPVQGMAGPPVQGQAQPQAQPTLSSVTPSASPSATHPKTESGSHTPAKGTASSSSGPTATYGNEALQTPYGDNPLGGASSTASPSASAAPSQSSGGMSGGAKAGLAFGIIIIVALIAGLGYFCFRRKKSQQNSHQKLQDEKSNLHDQQPSIKPHVSVRKSKTEAPRLSLRPVTEMFPDEKQEMSSTGQARGFAGARPPMPNNPSSNDLSNPFGDHAATPRELDATGGPGSAENAALGVAAPAPLRTRDDRSPGSPEDRAGASSPALSTRGPPGSPPNNVHRVQLDFKPSMEDELELRAGQVVRMLHEYDDGWALCIRLDRSQQGVVPRSCLSKLPIKPRPNGPPPSGMRGPPQGGRPRGPGQGAPRPMSPAMSAQPVDPRMRAPPPAAGRNRSQSNAAYGGAQRSMSPGPNGPYRGAPAGGRPRSNSASHASRRVTPPNMSPNSNATSPTQSGGIPSRKPVPGQAV